LKIPTQGILSAVGNRNKWASFNNPAFKGRLEFSEVDNQYHPFVGPEVPSVPLFPALSPISEMPRKKNNNNVKTTYKPLSKRGAVKLATPRPGSAANLLRGLSLSTRNKGAGVNPMNMAFPSTGSTQQGGFQIVEREEFVADIPGSVGFSTTQFPVNPGQALTFPWLAKIAALYEKYEFLALEFVYRPEVSGFATQGQTGKVVLNFDFDASDPPPGTRQQAEDTQPVASAMPYEDIMLRVNPNDMRDELRYHYVRSAGLPINSDIKTYDVGNFYVSTIGEANTTTIGELWVRYRVALRIPILTSTTVAPTNNSVTYVEQIAGQLAAATGVDVQMTWDTIHTNPLLITGLGAGAFVFPAGNYYASINIIGVSSIASNITEARLSFVNHTAGDTNLCRVHKMTVVNVGFNVYPTTLTGIFFTSNGTDVFRINCEYVYGAGTINIIGSMSIVLI